MRTGSSMLWPRLAVMGLAGVVGAVAGCMVDNTGPSVGSVAPTIEGEDVDGARFQLSDYRGKVVVLDFWGDW
jgi:cytochrome oxidase Cu insertion factor (SCO1/SenC/PrrC family)